MKLITNIIISLIKIYKLIISPYLNANCRYLPTCSEYFIDSLKLNGAIKGSYLGIKRIFRAIFAVAPITRNMGIQFVISFKKIPGNWIT